MNRIYDLFLLGRLLKRLYFEGAGLYFKNQKNLSNQEQGLLNDSEIVNNRAYELCAKAEFSFLEIYWKDLFNIVNSNDKDNKAFLKQVNRIYQQMDISIENSITDDDLLFYQLGTILSEQWIRIIASESIKELESTLQQFSFPNEYISTRFENINKIVKEFEKAIQMKNLELFNSLSEKLDKEIREIKFDKTEKKEIRDKFIHIEKYYQGNDVGNTFNAGKDITGVAIGNDNKIDVKITTTNNELENLLNELQAEINHIKTKLSDEDIKKIDKLITRLEEDVDDSDNETIRYNLDKISKITSIIDISFKVGDLISKIISLLI